MRSGSTAIDRAGRAIGWAAFMSVVLSTLFALTAPAAQAAPSYALCPSQQDASTCDADGDAIPDAVERVVAGSATAATGREDSDKDGVPDWTEVIACGSVKCASPTKDSAGDGIPDYARILTCGSVTCYTDNTDANSNGVPRWASIVICGTVDCATGHEDYDADGVSDAIQLAACVKPRGDLASTGQAIAIWLILASACGVIVTGVLLARKRALFAAATRPAGLA